MTRTWGAGVVAVLLTAALGVSHRAVGAQDLADYDYENLSFRGVGFEGGWIFPNNVDPTYSVGARFDLGYLGPGLRVMPRISYWSSDLDDGEVSDLERRLEALVDRESPPGTPPASVDLSPIEWRDLIVGLDGHFAWHAPGGILTYLGTGAAAHILNGRGPAVDGTFVEDLLDSVRAGVNLHAGLELAAHPRFRFYTEGRGEALGDLQYLELRAGGQFFVGSSPRVNRGSR